VDSPALEDAAAGRAGAVREVNHIQQTAISRLGSGEGA
jgi:hypothetical protein